MEDSSTTPLVNFDHNDQVDTKCARGGWRASVYLIGVEVAERFAIFGASGNLITYLTDVLHEPMATAAKNLNVWGGVTTLLPLLGGFIADVYLGGFKAILLSTVIYVVGLLLLTLSVRIPIEYQHVPFFMSLYLISIGQGGHKPCLQTFGANQFDEDNAEERRAKSAFFNWWYFGTCAGASAGMLIVFYIQENVGWFLGFAIPTIVLALGLVIFVLGRKSYRKGFHRASPITPAIQVFVAAYRKRHVCPSNDGCVYFECYEDGEPDVILGVELRGRNLPRTNQFKCLDRAAIVDDIDALSETKNDWRLCSVTQVEEVKLLLRLVPIWFSCLTYTVVFAQGGTFFTKQGSTMEKTIAHNFHISPASLQVSTSLSVLLFVPIYDQIVIPIARAFTGYPSGITMLQRIGCGMFLATIEMVVAALVETRRVQIATEHGLLDQPNATVPMSIWLLLPQYVILGVSNAFTFVGMQELFYDQMPDNMRSIGSAIYLSAIGIGSFLSSGLISTVQYTSSSTGDMWLVDNLNRAHLDYYYWLLAVMSSLGLALFIIIAKCFMYKRSYSDTSSS